MRKSIKKLNLKKQTILSLSETPKIMGGGFSECCVQTCGGQTSSFPTTITQQDIDE